MLNDTVLIIGANSAIASALTQMHLNKGDEVFAVSRSLEKQLSGPNHRLHWLTTDHSEYNIHELISGMDAAIEFTRVYICLGVLHNDHIRPEKKMEDIHLQKTQEVFTINTLLPMLWLKSLKPRLRKSSDCTLTFFSARVGSISDNYRGGWYSYRSSKAALNMLLKSASIELAHLNKNIKLLAFHPGTVDSFLSKPFQKMLAEGQLLHADDVAQRLDNIIDGLVKDGQLSYLDWKGEEIAF